jgi:hypothetical protein
MDVTKLLLPKVPLQVFGLSLKHSLTQQLLTFRILTASVLVNCDFPEPLLGVMVLQKQPTRFELRLIFYAPLSLNENNCLDYKQSSVRVKKLLQLIVELFSVDGHLNCHLVHF